MHNNKTPILTVDEALAKYCPNARTLKEICGDDEEKLNEYCAYFNCKPDELMLGKFELAKLINFAPISATKKMKFRTMLSQM